ELQPQPHLDFSCSQRDTFVVKPKQILTILHLISANSRISADQFQNSTIPSCISYSCLFPNRFWRKMYHASASSGAARSDLRGEVTLNLGNVAQGGHISAPLQAHGGGHNRLRPAFTRVLAGLSQTDPVCRGPSHRRTSH